MRIIRFGALLAFLAATPLAAATGYYQDDGFFVFLDAAMTQPADTDQVLGYSRSLGDPADPTVPQQVTPVMIDWQDGTSGRLGFGYRWGSSRVSVSYWQFDDDEMRTFDGPSGGYTNFAIGPAFYLYNGIYYPVYNLGSPGFMDFKSELEATTIDLEYEHTHQVSDYFDFRWSVGARFASFEEKLDGVYDVCASGGCEGFYAGNPFFFIPGDVTFSVAKMNEGDMGGIRVGVGGSYFATNTFAISGSLALTSLMGELTSSSGLTPTGVVNGLDPPTLALVEDDDRSGTIRDVEVALEWYFVEDRLRLALGYRHSLWDGIAGDLVRNPPGLLTTNPERDQVAFSGFTLGVRYDF